MAESKGTVVTRNLVADYLDIGNSETPDIRVMSVFETIDENPQCSDHTEALHCRQIRHYADYRLSDAVSNHCGPVQGQQGRRVHP